jgi:hypothetical protein
MKIEIGDLGKGALAAVDIDDFISRIPPKLMADLRRAAASDDVKPGILEHIALSADMGKAVFLDGVPVVLFGAIPEGERAACVWIFEASPFEKIKLSFVRICAGHFIEWGERRGYMHGYVSEDFPEMLRAFKWGGCDLRYLGPEFLNYVEVSKSWGSRQ